MAVTLVTVNSGDDRDSVGVVVAIKLESHSWYKILVPNYKNFPLVQKTL